MLRVDSGARGVPRSGLLQQWYEALLAAHGHRGWWPGRSRTEIILGALLTQHTAWVNVEKVLGELRDAGLLDFDRLRTISDTELAAHLRSSGAFRQKARKVRSFLKTLDETAGGSLARMARIPTAELRAALLATWGIGPETADCILLYAFARPVFVVDAYTRRVLMRHGLMQEGAPYAEVQALFHRGLPANPDVWNDYHAQFVRVGQERCRPAGPCCEGCPLEPFLGGGTRSKPGKALRGTGGRAVRSRRTMV